MLRLLLIFKPFQSTLPCGSDALPKAPAIAPAIDFNPRSLAGATAKAAIIDCKRLISIHAPLRERPQHLRLHRYPIYDFNPRSLAGATGEKMKLYCIYDNFNPRSLAGATTQPSLADQTFAISIHAPLRERLLVIT